MVAEPDPVRKWIVDDLDALLKALPPDLVAPLRQRSDLPELLEVVIDLGRSPEARFPFGSVTLREGEATAADIQYVVSRIGSFGEDNRAGIPRTLHRISCIRNRKGDVIGLTCRVGRAVYGTVKIIEDLVQMGESILFLGKPGVGKTTLLREVARVLADDLHKRVVIVDTSNEIAGDGDIPHPAIGRSRRMQVPTPTLQHAVMIEAVENHMPEVIIVDEMGTELEAAAARTIAERGVQLVATAHGNTLENLIMNPTLSDLVGGIQSVTLGDEEARRRGTQKSILERKAPPTFDILVEIQSWDRLAVHTDVAEVVDSLLRGGVVTPEVRWIDQAGNVRIERPSVVSEMAGPRLKGGPRASSAEARTRVYALGVNRSRIEQTARAGHMPIEMVYDLANADVVMTTKAYYRNRPQVLRTAEASGVPIHVLRKSTPMQIEQSLRGFVKGGERPHDPMGVAVKEVEEAVNRLKAGESKVELSPQSAYIRRIQHQIAEKYRVTTRSVGKEPFRRVTVFSDGGGEVEGGDR